MEKSKDMTTVQVWLDEELVDNVNSVLEKLSINETVLITKLYEQIQASGEIPFDMTLSEDDEATEKLLEAMKLVPTTNVNSMEELIEWLDEDDD
ncbi:RelB/DinJ family addiction module antitoxin [Enterococcus devriesei]|uniref:RelB/DinJ family addiction module antitoxin n=1 Tax=Enterococcus devriesei TaxID=319970 RepID=UPI0036D3FAF3